MAKKIPKPTTVEDVIIEALAIEDVINDIPDAVIEEFIAIPDDAVLLDRVKTDVKPGVYVTNKALLAEFKVSREKGEMTNELARMVMLICERYARRGSYASYTYNEDLQSFALMNLVKSWKSFNPEKSQNPFAYFTSCIHNSFLQYLNHERKHRNIRDALLVENGLDPSYTYTGSYQYNNEATQEGGEPQSTQDDKANQTTE